MIFNDEEEEVIVDDENLNLENPEEIPGDELSEPQEIPTEDGIPTEEEVPSLEDEIPDEGEPLEEEPDDIDPDTELDDLMASIEESGEESGEILDTLEQKVAGDEDLTSEVAKLRLSEKQKQADIDALNSLVGKLTKDTGDFKMQLAEKEVFGGVENPKLMVLMKYLDDDSDVGNQKTVQILKDLYEEKTGKNIDEELTNEEADILSLAGNIGGEQGGVNLNGQEEQAFVL